MINKQKGFGQIVLIILLLLGIIALSAFSFYYLKFKGGVGQNKTSLYTSPTPTRSPATKTEVGNISEKTDTKTLQTELDATSLESIDTDLDSLNASAGGI